TSAASSPSCAASSASSTSPRIARVMRRTDPAYASTSVPSAARSPASARATSAGSSTLAWPGGSGSGSALMLLYTGGHRAMLTTRKPADPAEDGQVGAQHAALPLSAPPVVAVVFQLGA